MVQINNGRPVITGTDNHPSPDFNEHWIITHGYYYNPSGSDYIIANDGFGHNNMYYTADGTYYDDIIYLNH